MESVNDVSRSGSEYIQTGRVYKTEDLVRILGVSKSTLSGWSDKSRQRPLPFRQPGTKSKLYLGDQVIEWIFGEPDPDSKQISERN